MTQREEQILEWIRENPLISQQELAEKAGITRSSVGVHIANLMKKGYIKGRGYLVEAERYICVIGAVNVDISGTPDTTYVPGDSNPGHVRITLGGVGRNIAENLCRLGHRVVMITAMGEDANAQLVRQGCREIGLDLTHSLTVREGRTSTYLCLNDEQGEIVGAVSDMGIYEAITPEFLRTRLDVINGAALVVVDANLSGEALDFLGENVTALIIQAAPFVEAIFQGDNSLFSVLINNILIGFREQILYFYYLAATEGTGINIRIQIPTIKIVGTTLATLNRKFGLTE